MKSKPRRPSVWTNKDTYELLQYGSMGLNAIGTILESSPFAPIGIAINSISAATAFGATKYGLKTGLISQKQANIQYGMDALMVGGSLVSGIKSAAFGAQSLNYVKESANAAISMTQKDSEFAGTTINRMSSTFRHNPDEYFKDSGVVQKVGVSSKRSVKFEDIQQTTTVKTEIEDILNNDDRNFEQKKGYKPTKYERTEKEKLQKELDRQLQEELEKLPEEERAQASQESRDKARQATWSKIKEREESEKELREADLWDENWSKRKSTRKNMQNIIEERNFAASNMEMYTKAAVAQRVFQGAGVGIAFAARTGIQLTNIFDLSRN